MTNWVIGHSTFIGHSGIRHWSLVCDLLASRFSLLFCVMKSIAKKCFEMSSLFEAELLVRLMLWRWGHPLAGDEEFAKGLLEDASEALREASEGEELIEGAPAGSMNFVAAVWCAEQCAVEAGEGRPETIEARKRWLGAVRRALPSCFCDPADLPQG
jgi:hypothetical protein